jgi:hypothetical protein|tara:strand:- start:3128 stop:3859 length:732 start_codon:yes stop_codon:yes gene_type:complete
MDMISSGSGLGRRLTDKFEVKSGSCTTSGACFQSPNYPSNYEESQTCTIKVLNVGDGEKLYSTAFNTESDYDELTIGVTKYSGTAGPGGVVVSTNDEFSWSSDGVTVRSGFRICLAQICSQTNGATINTNTESSCGCGSTVCDGTKGMYCLAASNKCAATKITDKFLVKEGKCTTSGDCFQSPNYPRNYDSACCDEDETCTIKVLSDGINEKLFVKAFDTYINEDKLMIGGTEYSGTTGPTGK